MRELMANVNPDPKPDPFMLQAIPLSSVNKNKPTTQDQINILN